MPLPNLMELLKESRRLSALCDLNTDRIQLSADQRARIVKIWQDQSRKAEVTVHGVRLWTGPTYHMIIDDVTFVRCAASVPFYLGLLKYQKKVEEIAEKLGVSAKYVELFARIINDSHKLEDDSKWIDAIDKDDEISEEEKNWLKDFIFRPEKTTYHKGIARSDFYDPAVCYAQNVSVEFHKFNSNITAAMSGDPVFANELVKIIPDEWTAEEWALGVIIFIRHVLKEGITRLRADLAKLTDRATSRVSASWDRRMANFSYAYSKGTKGLEGGSNTPSKCLEWLEKLRKDEKEVMDMASGAVIDCPEGVELCKRLELNPPRLSSSSRFEGGYNRIYAGCPGTGKSWQVKNVVGSSKAVWTAFHPEYTYSNFVGSYRPVCGTDPVQKILSLDGREISRPVSYFAFVPGPFLEACATALKNQGLPVYLVIEEINRGDCAAIFGDMFQILDRESSGRGEYCITLKPEIMKWFGDQDVEGDLEKDDLGSGRLRLPANMILLATMNTSDQSLFPMDSAFKRRWQWEAVALDTDVEALRNVLINDPDGCRWHWLSLIRTLNSLIMEAQLYEDKRIGPWFLRAEGNSLDIQEFRSKLLFYLWHDVFRNERTRFFNEKVTTFEEIQNIFDEKGLKAVVSPSAFGKLSKAMINETVEQPAKEPGFRTELEADSEKG